MQLETARARFREALATILGALRSQESNKRAIVSQLTQIRQAFRAEGILARLDDQHFHGGHVPDEVSLSALHNWLEKYDRGAISASTTINPALEKYPALVRFASGLLYIPLGTQDFLLLTRPEQIETVNWAGKPQSATVIGDDVPDFLKEIRRPFAIRGQSVEIGVSIGVSMCPSHAIEYDELLEDADLALYQAKLAGRNTFKSYANNMVSDKEQKVSVRQGLTMPCVMTYCGSPTNPLLLQKPKPCNHLKRLPAGSIRLKAI